MPKKLVYKLDNSKKVYTRTDLQAMGYERYAVDQMVKKGMLNKITGSFLKIKIMMDQNLIFILYLH